MKTPVLLLVAAIGLAAGAMLPKVADHPSNREAIPQETVLDETAPLAQTEPAPGEQQEPESPDVPADTLGSEVETGQTASVEEQEAEAARRAELTRRIETITPRYSLGLQDIVRLVQGGIDKQVILAYIKSSRVPFAPTSQQVVQLHQLGASTEIIKAIIDHGIEVRTQQAQAFKEQQERLVQQRQEAIQAAQAAYAAAQNRNSQIPAGATAAQGPNYNTGIGNGANNQNYAIYPAYTYAWIPQGFRGRGSTQIPYAVPQPPFTAAPPSSNFKYASTFRWALPNTSYRSPEGYTAPLPQALRDRQK